MNRYITKEYLDLTGQFPERCTISLLEHVTHDENTVTPYPNTDAFVRIKNVDGSLYMYASKEELNAEQLRELIDEFKLSPL
ncbi:hypothetical protein ACR9UB_003423 [Cronobacter dublinensis]